MDLLGNSMEMSQSYENKDDKRKKKFYENMSVKVSSPEIGFVTRSHPISLPAL